MTGTEFGEAVIARLDELWLTATERRVDADLLAALGLREQALLAGRGPLGVLTEDADTLGRLLTALAGRSALLVLDNCEHPVAAAARLADRVLAVCPQVRILATSREPLSITGEALWTVGPLTLPPDPAVTSGKGDRLLSRLIRAEGLTGIASSGSLRAAARPVTSAVTPAPPERPSAAEPVTECHYTPQEG